MEPELGAKDNSKLVDPIKVEDGSGSQTVARLAHLPEERPVRTGIGFGYVGRGSEGSPMDEY